MTSSDTQPYLKEERLRAIRLTNLISISLFVLSMLIGVAYSFSTVTDTLHYKVWLISPLYLIPLFLNRAGKFNLSRTLLSSLLPTIVMFLSISSKSLVIDLDIINPVNYFDIRIILINALLIPFLLFSLKELKWLIISIVPAYACLMLFDPIHNFFEVGYYAAGMVSHDYYFSANLFTLITVIFLSLMMLMFKSQVLRSDYRQAQENNKIKLYLSELVKLSNSQSINNGEVANAKIEILKSAAACLGVSRISIWKFNHDKESITCEYLLEKGKLTKPETELFASDYPSYFVELKHQQLIIARDAQEHSATAGFTENYLKPLSIYSLMDAPFLKKGKLGGVICCEHQNEYKSWGAAESLFLKALGDFLSYTLIVEERIKQNQLLLVKNSETSKLNQSLESIVNQRTEELKEKNKQLTEYAYINSHILRAPVARISGLYNLFKMEYISKIDDPSICDHMGNAIEELEQVTLNINRAIEAHGMFSREQLKR